MSAKLKRFSLLAVIAVLVFALAGCSGKSNGDGKSKKDVVTIWTFPVEKDYNKNFDKIKKDFEDKNPNITLKKEELTWAEGIKKFDTAVNAGNPPDLMFVVPSAKYVETGLAVPLEKYLPKDALSDYYPSGLDYMKVDGKLYGLPLYMKLHSIAGNPKLMDEAGVDWKKVQENGWTWDEFKQMIKAGTKKNADGKQQYAFVFHGAETDPTELLSHMLVNNGLTSDIDENGKYTYSSPKFLETLKFIRSLIDDGLMPKESNQITPAKRMEYFYSEQAMIIGKAMPYYEVVIGDNNAKVKSGEAPEGQKEVDFALLPEPHNDGADSVTPGGVDGYSMFKQAKYKGSVNQETHLKNVAKALVALTSGDAGASAKVLNLPQVSKTGDQMWGDKYTMKPENKAMVDRLFKTVLSPTQVDPKKSEKASKIFAEVIVPKYSALLGGDITPEEMYKAVVDRAKQDFGDDIVTPKK